MEAAATTLPDHLPHSRATNTNGTVGRDYYTRRGRPLHRHRPSTDPSCCSPARCNPVPRRRRHTVSVPVVGMAIALPAGLKGAAHHGPCRLRPRSPLPSAPRRCRRRRRRRRMSPHPYASPLPADSPFRHQQRRREHKFRLLSPDTAGRRGGKRRAPRRRMVRWPAAQPPAVTPERGTLPPPMLRALQPQPTDASTRACAIAYARTTAAMPVATRSAQALSRGHGRRPHLEPHAHRAASRCQRIAPRPVCKGEATSTP